MERRKDEGDLGGKGEKETKKNQIKSGKQKKSSWRKFMTKEHFPM